MDLRIPPPPEAAKVCDMRGKQKTFYSTNKEILAKIQKLHPLPILILEYRRLQGLLSKCVTPIVKEGLITRTLGMDRIHGRCVTGTVTGRISMVEPSLQNIPKNFAVDTWMELSQNHGRASKFERTSDDRLCISLRSAFVPFQGRRLWLSYWISFNSFLGSGDNSLKFIARKNENYENFPFQKFKFKAKFHGMRLSVGTTKSRVKRRTESNFTLKKHGIEKLCLFSS